MAEEAKNSVKIDLNQFKLHLHLKPEVELTLHFDSPSRKFYLSIICLVAHEMKKRGRITSISLQDHLDEIILLNKTIGASAGSSKREHLFSRIYKKWKDALPDLEHAPLFKVVGRKKRYDESMEKAYSFNENEKDKWANLFEYKGSHQNVRLRFSIDRLGVNLDDVFIEYGEYLELESKDAWIKFITHLKNHEEYKSIPEAAGQEPIDPDVSEVQSKKGSKPFPKTLRRLALCTLGFVVLGFAWFAILNIQKFAPIVKNASDANISTSILKKPAIAVLPFRNLSADPEQEYFTDGMTDDLITDLSKISGLFVIGRNSTYMYKGRLIKNSIVAEALGVRYVLRGSVRKAVNEVRINVHLIDASNGRCIWAERYDNQIEDIFYLL